MQTSTWTEVIDTTTGRIYASCEEVERRHGVPAVVVRACIQTGKSINGHHFECVTRRAQGGVPSWMSAAEASRMGAKARKGKASGTRDSVTTPEDRARAVEMYEQGALLADISAELGRSVETRDITRWNGGVKPERPPGFWNHGKGAGITINNKRPSWENPPSVAVDGPEGAESGDSSPA